MRRVIEVVRALLTEQKILVTSKYFIFVSALTSCVRSSKTMLSAACECFVSFLYPLSWSHVYVPVMPYSMNGFLSSPTPFIIGILTENLPKAPEIPDVSILV